MAQKSIRKHLIPILLITLIVLIAYPGFMSSKFYGFDDLSRLNIPQRMFAAYSWKHGQIPLWNPFNFGGQPFLAAGQAGALYLPNILYIFFPVEQATRCLYFIHELFAAYSMYGLIYYLDKRRCGALVGSVSFVTCGFLVGHQIHTQMFNAFCWFPLLIYLFIRMLETASSRRTILFAFCFAGEIYAGHPQITFYLSLFIGVYTLLYILQHKPTHQGTIIKLAYASISFFLAIGLSAAQLLPTLHLTMYSNRDNASGQFLLGGSMPPLGLTQWLDPYLAGGGLSNVPFSASSYANLFGSTLYWEFLDYIGLIALTIAITGAIFAWRTSLIVRRFAIICILTTTFSLGANTVLSYVLVHAPGFNLFRIPARYIGISDFSLAVLCGLGINQLTHNPDKRFIKLFIGVLTSFTFITVLLTFILPIRTSQQGFLLWPILLCMILAFISFIAFSDYKKWLKQTVAVFAILDCVTAAHSMSSFPLTASASYLTPTKADIYLIRHTQNEYPFTRVLSMPDTSIAYDASSAFGIPTIDGYDSLVSKWYVDNVNLTWGTWTITHQSRWLLDALGVQYVITKTGFTPFQVQSLPGSLGGITGFQNWIPVYVGKEETIWKNPDTIHAAWLTDSTSTQSGDFMQNSDIQLTSWHLNQTEWVIHASRPGYAVISQMYDPGWTASLNGKTASVKQIQNVLTGIRIEKPGTYVLTLQYQPRSFQTGKWITFISFVLICTFVIYKLNNSLFRRRRPV